MKLKIKRLSKSSIHMGRHDIQPMRMVSPGSTLVCDTGVLWITQSRDYDDHILYSGDRLVVTQRGKVLVEALREADLHIA